jgi:iron complex outermembrane receptor protein
LQRFLILLSFLLSVPVLQSQTNVGIAGTLRDPDASVVADATVTLLSAEGVALTTTTDSSGRYVFNGVTPGTYRFQARKSGFAPIELSSISVVISGGTTLDVAFKLASASQDVTVNGSSVGSAAEGYYISNVDRGVMGNASIVNQPYTLTTISAQEIQNIQAKSFRDTMKFLPLVSFTEQQGPEILRPATRGFQGSIAQNTRMDGMAIAITGANAMEQYRELQVENGLGAAMYGPANPSGMFDYVLKRPTEERTNNIYLEQDSSSVGTIYGDFGGRVGPHKIFGYRSNLLYGDGTQFVEASRLRRRLAEFAFDLRPTNSTMVDAHYSVYDIVQRGYPGWFSYGPSSKTNAAAPDFILPSAPDPTVRGYGQAYAGVNLTTQSASARLLHDFSPNWHAMMGGLAQRLDRFIDTPVNTITDNSGDYSSSLGSGFAPRFGVESDLGYITGLIDTWHIRQDVVLASEGYRFNQYSGTAISTANLLLGTANIDAPKILSAPLVGLPRNTGLFQSAVVHQQGINFGDLITFPYHLSVRLSASQDWIGVDNYTALVRTSGSNKNGVSPSASIMYKPTSWSTAYATYASSLQQGDIAPISATLVNSGAVLPPYRSKEWEVGFKTDVHPLAITTTLFRLERPFADTIAYDGSTTRTIYTIIGQQVNYGAEISAQGTLFHRLLVDGGFTALSARLDNTNVASTNGKRFVGIPDYKSNILTEYRIPGVVNLTFTGDWQFIGARPQDDQNLHYTAATSTFDFGTRYSHTLFTKLATLRFTCNNVTNTRYYSTISAGDITGTNASANTAHLGNPRSISTSLQFAF